MSALTSQWQRLDPTAQVALIGLVVAWLIFRLGQSSERKGVIAALRQELEMHSLWVGSEYPPGKIPVGQDWEDPTRGVHKLSLVAVDNAITRGPSLFLNRRLVKALVGYRQAAYNLNQMIDLALPLQVELFAGHGSSTLIDRILLQTQMIHWLGIGDRQNEKNKAAHWHFWRVGKELQAERRAPVSWFLWFLTGVTWLFAAERFVYPWLDPRRLVRRPVQHLQG